jgi:pilus assembly protein CpaB
MYRRFILVLGFALVIAALSSYVVYRLVITNVQRPQPKAAPIARLKVVVATRNLQTGDLIGAGDVREIEWSGNIPDHAILKAGDAIGRGTLASIFNGEPIIDGRLAPVGAGAGLASTIPIGKRAVALRVNEVVGLAGFVTPGARVDVVVAGSSPGSEPLAGVLSRTVLQDIEVLSAGQKTDKDAGGKPENVQVVNLLVTPDQAEILSLAGSETKVQLVLRNPMDRKEQATHGTSVASLFGQSIKPAPVAAAQPAPAPVAVQVAAPPTQEPVVQIFNGRRSDQSSSAGGR